MRPRTTAVRPVLRRWMFARRDWRAPGPQKGGACCLGHRSQANGWRRGMAQQELHTTHNTFIISTLNGLEEGAVWRYADPRRQDQLASVAFFARHPHTSL